MRMFIFLPFFIVFFQFLSCEGIYYFLLPSVSYALLYQVRQTRGPGGCGPPGLEEDPATQGIVLVTTQRLRMRAVRMVGTKIYFIISFICILFRKLSTLELLESLPNSSSNPNNPLLLSDPDESVFGNLC